jgi:hypothetical protein
MPPWNKGKKGLPSMCGKPASDKVREVRAHLNKVDPVAEKPGVREKMRAAKLGKPGLNKGKRWKIDRSKLKNLGKIKGEKHWNFKGGLPQESKLARKNAFYKDWREAVFTRDNYTCQECNLRGCYLEPHHIKRFIEYKELRYDINNGITLCKSCHKKTLFKEKHYEAAYIGIIERIK